ncbi:hypothetical protein DQ04_13001020, partial [Trypanosoma grayi]|uniref:hypothetical protein n=1 Tax=Trypanosoma grayi TaxID=71804 RepID=UPI0004F4366B
HTHTRTQTQVRCIRSLGVCPLTFIGRRQVQEEAHAHRRCHSLRSASVYDCWYCCRLPQQHTDHPPPLFHSPPLDSCMSPPTHATRVGRDASRPPHSLLPDVPTACECGGVCHSAFIAPAPGAWSIATSTMQKRKYNTLRPHSPHFRTEHPPEPRASSLLRCALAFAPRRCRLRAKTGRTSRAAGVTVRPKQTGQDPLCSGTAEKRG